jgi:hypothetical protein
MDGGGKIYENIRETCSRDYCILTVTVLLLILGNVYGYIDILS